ncbi:MAG TPA: hypothetical protein QF720_06550 [Nitrospinota bacterium]|nr:hypothetical protein [Nitrospinota bacterium]|tara:strand:- start:8831 stop:9025 length:195 start_codon:yes stop_codon:yes gene_type:complete
MLASLSSLQDESLQSVQDLEKELGNTLLAYTIHDFKPAMLSEEQISKIKELEGELGVALVAMAN